MNETCIEQVKKTHSSLKHQNKSLEVYKMQTISNTKLNFLSVKILQYRVAMPYKLSRHHMPSDGVNGAAANQLSFHIVWYFWLFYKFVSCRKIYEKYVSKSKWCILQSHWLHTYDLSFPCPLCYLHIQQNSTFDMTCTTKQWSLRTWWTAGKMLVVRFCPSFLLLAQVNPDTTQNLLALIIKREIFLVDLSSLSHSNSTKLSAQLKFSFIINISVFLVALQLNQ